MSKAIRTLGVGLLTSGWLFYTYQIPFIKYMAQASTHLPYELAVHTLSRTDAGLLGMGDYIVLLYTLLCLGAGLLITGILWPFVENTISLVEQLIGYALISVRDRLFGGPVTKSAVYRGQSGTIAGK
ncbi:hypothetical protein A6M27_16565 [Acidithiobacillus thiooxidans]|uniref:Uncharacterized protein n=1 Tax=Acidithiobacillus thiooxidans TaxID=930 RepID=A0A1C2HZX0_ACITH|nr:hypothetical protein [Acidithiobacillus thiooxidans]OCX69282.1 hypothetical protein A6P07_16790 [Acidithiobacillus thiooxidans]OCX77872.1 hypothetical protein A6O24_05960 [Acidithiobacillus thiooxidans]OCX84139.1 hypothetical protein A6M27_16565 [Acidithiobacillus thiooxidans]OCX85800.1 hypothetical protein A6O26_00210 [Acidithiobacillus thiooxidans]OFC48533.1 hypothetical protein BAE47_07520 [Acidithiobacillus thiooxidans]